MAEYLFPRFLDDPEEYAAAEAYWRRLWDEVAGLAGAAWEWKHPWLQTAYADGTPFRDGDPIFSAWAPSRNLGLRVIQNRPHRQDPALEFWPDVVGDEWSGEVRTLVISCELSRQTAALARGMIFSWLRYGKVSISRPLLAGPLAVDPQPRGFTLGVPRHARRESPVSLVIPA
jgi:hypothetical protein